MLVRPREHLEIILSFKSQSLRLQYNFRDINQYYKTYKSTSDDQDDCYHSTFATFSKALFLSFFLQIKCFCVE